MSSVAQLPRMRAQSMTVEALTDRLAAVRKVLVASSSFSAAAIESTLEWYFEKLGLPRTYFDTNDDETIAHHITSIQGACTMRRMLRKVISQDVSPCRFG
jgi:hypothetical protein